MNEKLKLFDELGIENYDLQRRSDIGEKKCVQSDAV